MNVIEMRLEALRASMRKAGITAYYIPTDDFHLSEYVGDHFKCRAYLSGFTGSAGVLIVTLEEAGLWVDGRYFIQGEEQLKGTSITLYKMGEEGVPTTLEFLRSRLAAGDVLGFDGRTADALLTGPETRSSSPLRMLRNERRESPFAGLYPLGEGAGYAGGIVSAAVVVTWFLLRNSSFPLHYGTLTWSNINSFLTCKKWIVFLF